jgi:signal transduction histidine kinase
MWTRVFAVRRASFDLGELLPAGLVLGLGMQEVWLPLGSNFAQPHGPRLAQATHVLLLAAALVWRCRRPLATALAVNAVLSLYALLFGSPDGLVEIVPVGVALYSLGRHSDILALLVGVLTSATNFAIHAWRDSQVLPLGPQLTMWCAIVGAGVVGRFITITARATESYAIRAETAERERDERMRASAAAERARIAHELHDLVGHGISVVVLQAVGAQAALEAGRTDASRALLTQLETSARNTMAEMRRLFTVMGDDDGSLVPQPGVGDIAALVETLRATGVPVELCVDDGAADVPSGVGLAAFRLVQEGLTNVVKHAGRGVPVRVAVTVRDRVLDIEVFDAGATASMSFEPGRGIAGMRERVALYGGTLQVGPQDGGGFSVRASLPISADPV